MEAGSLNKSDIGRAVVFTPLFKGQSKEFGTITSYNSTYVFVRFGSDLHSKACKYQNLEFEHSGALKTYSCHYSRVGLTFFEALKIDQRIDEIQVLRKTYRNCQIIAKDAETGTFRFSYD